MNSEAFLDERSGVTKLINAYRALKDEFRQVTTDLNATRSEIEKLATEIQQLQTKLNGGTGDLKSIRAEIEQKNDEGSRLQIELKRKQEDAKARFEKREKQVTEPIYKEIGDALDAFSTKNSIDLILDVSKTNAILMVNGAIDVTDAFIREFNARSSGVPVK